MLPAGMKGESAELYMTSMTVFRHHIDYIKSCNEVMDLILLGNLHYSGTR